MDQATLTTAEKKAIVIDRICRALTSRRDDNAECIMGDDARAIVEHWFKTDNFQFGGKTPEECLDMDFDRLLEYIDYIDMRYLHENFDQTEDFKLFDERVRRDRTSYK